MKDENGDPMSPLWEAVLKKDLRRFRKLLAAGEEMNVRNAPPGSGGRGETVLQYCAGYSGDPILAEMAHALLEAGADPATATHAIGGAAGSGDETLVRTLLEAGADPNCRAGCSLPLQAAVLNGFASIARILIQAGADVNAGSAIGTPLQQAIKFDDEESACVLIEAGARVHTERPSPILLPFNPLCEATLRGQTHVVGSLIRAGVDLESRATVSKVNSTDEVGEVVVRDEVTTTKSGATVRVRETRYESCGPHYQNATALIIAAGEGHNEIVRLLVEARAKLDAVDDTCRTAVDNAKVRNRLEILEYPEPLGGAEPPAVDPNLRWLYSAETGDEAGARQALAAGANVDAYDKRDKSQGRTATMLAAARGHITVLRMLLGAGAVADLCERSGKGGDDGISAIAELAGIDSLIEDMPGSLGLTALMLAAWHGQAGAVRILLSAGADATLRDKLGNTARSLAEKKRHQETVALLPGTPGAEKPERELAKQPKPPPNPKKAPKQIPASYLRKFQGPAIIRRLHEQGAKLNWEAILQRLERFCGAKPKKEDLNVVCYSCHVHSSKSLNVTAVQGKFLALGCFLFAAHEDGKGRPTRLFVLPTTDKYEALAFMGTDAANYNVATKDIICWLMELEQEQPFLITRIQHDVVAGVFTRPIRDPDGLAERMFEFCPDIVDQGCGEVAELAKELGKKPARFFLWWD